LILDVVDVRSLSTTAFQIEFYFILALTGGGYFDLSVDFYVLNNVNSLEYMGGDSEEIVRTY